MVTLNFVLRVSLLAIFSMWVIVSFLKYEISFKTLKDAFLKKKYTAHFPAFATAFIQFQNKDIEKRIKLFYKFCERTIFDKSEVYKMHQKLIFLLENKINTEFSVGKLHKYKHKERIKFIELLFVIASSSKPINKEELNYIEALSKELEISRAVFFAIKSKFVVEEEKSKNKKQTYDSFLKKNIALQEAFSILQIPNNSEQKIVKKKYRQLVKKFHPDKFSQKNEIEKQKAHEYFIKIQNAYDVIINN